MQLKCLVVDDEPLSQDVMVEFVRSCPELILAGICNDALEAGRILQQDYIDLLFLDINMPKLSGIDFIKSLKEPPLFVLVTAYPEYALKGFEVDAVDYLVKPVSFERFRIAVNRAQERFSGKIQKSALTEHIMVRADKKNYRIHFDEIFFLEAQGDYVKFVTSGKSLMVHGTLKDFDAQLPSAGFVQIHKSYIISLSKVDYIEGNLLKIGDYKLPVSMTYREQLMQKLN